MDKPSICVGLTLTKTSSLWMAIGANCVSTARAPWLAPADRQRVFDGNARAVYGRRSTQRARQIS